MFREETQRDLKDELPKLSWRVNCIGSDFKTKGKDVVSDQKEVTTDKSFTVVVGDQMVSTFTLTVKEQEYGTTTNPPCYLLSEKGDEFNYKSLQSNYIFF